MSDIKQFVTKFMRARRLSISGLALRLGYRSQTSVVRVMQGTANKESMRKFALALSKTFEMSDDEKKELDEVLQTAVLGKEYYLAQKEMWAFINGRPQSVVENDVIIESLWGGSRRLLAERYADADDIHIKLLNCQYIPIFSQLKTLLKRKRAKVEQYILLDSNVARTIRTINALIPIFYEKLYTCHVIDKARLDDGGGIIGSDIMVCSYLDRDGVRYDDIIVFNEREHGFVMSHLSDGYGGYERLLGIPYDKCQEFKRTYFKYQAMDNYIQYITDYANLEIDRAVYKIKPDIGIDYISPEILEAALIDGPITIDDHISSLLDSFKSVHAKRYANAFSKRCPAYTILKENAMRRFAATGKTSDHFWGMRAFTPEERARVLNELIKQQKQNPYFHLCFLRDDDALRDVEIAYYEGIGVLILNASTDYNLAEGHSEAIITYGKFAQLYKDFMLNTLIKLEALTPEETTAKLARLMELCK